jgi:hypothetical protein
MRDHMANDVMIEDNAEEREGLGGHNLPWRGSLAVAKKRWAAGRFSLKPVGRLLVTDRPDVLLRGVEVVLGVSRLRYWTCAEN